MNIKKYLLINGCVLLLLLFVAEFLCFQSYKFRYSSLIESQSQNCEDVEQAKKELAIRYKAPRFCKIEGMNDSERIFQGTSDKKPIIVIGCSYAYGVCLDREDNFAANLNKVTGRKTYNRGIPGSGPQFVYLQLKNKQIKQDIPEADIIIYPFIYSHISRSFEHLLTYFLTDINPLLEEKNGKLIEKKQPFWFLYSSFIAKVFLEYSDEQTYFKELNAGKPLFFKTLEESYKEAKKKYPNVKFVLLEVSQGNMCEPDYQKGSQELTEEDINRIKSLGIIYLNAEEVVGHDFRDVDKYRIADKDHPNGKLWAELTPKLVQKLGI